MIFFLISSMPFLLYLFSKSLPLKPLPRWAHELGLLSFLLLRESAEVGVQWLRDCRLVIPKVFRFPSRMSTRIGKKCAPIPETENAEEMPDMTILDLPELTLDCILGKLSPVGLCRMASVCTSLKDMCRSDHLWERYMREKWDRVIGPVARRELECYLALKKNNSFVSTVKPKNWTWPLSCFWSSSWFMTKDDGGSKPVSSSAASSIMSFYVALESGGFWFPAQVYNRENGHVGFMLSCYDAELSYDCRSDTFQARYPPHGQRAVNVEEAVPWERLRAPPVDTPAYDLHVSDCLGELQPGDHIEIQWRKNTEFPYGWWYGVVGHLELCDHCDGNAHHCHCLYSDTIILEFSHYTAGSRWRKTAVNRKDHKEEGNEIDGFYGGIRKLYRKEEISAWRRLWPSEVLA